MKNLRKALSDKVRSNRGASLSMALLLFLVCAILGAVVLTSATSAVGRIAQMAETDQRYYRVTSAAELLADAIENETVTIVRTKTRTEKVTTAYTVTGDLNNEIATPQPNPSVKKTVTYKTNINNNSPSSQPQDKSATTNDGTEPVVVNGSIVSMSATDRSFLTARAIDMLFGADQVCNNDAAFDATIARGNNTASGSFTLTHDSDDVDVASLSVKGDYTLTADGALLVMLTGDNYSVMVTMKPDFSETTEIATDTVSTVVHDTGSRNYTETVETVITTTITSVLKWECDSIR